MASLVYIYVFAILGYLVGCVGCSMLRQGICANIFVLATLRHVQTMATAVTMLMGHVIVSVKLGTLVHTVS